MFCLWCARICYLHYPHVIAAVITNSSAPNFHFESLKGRMGNKFQDCCCTDWTANFRNPFFSVYKEKNRGNASPKLSLPSTYQTRTSFVTNTYFHFNKPGEDKELYFAIALHRLQQDNLVPIGVSTHFDPTHRGFGRFFAVRTAYKGIFAVYQVNLHIALLACQLQVHPFLWINLPY